MNIRSLAQRFIKMFRKQVLKRCGFSIADVLVVHAVDLTYDENSKQVVPVLSLSADESDDEGQLFQALVNDITLFDPGKNKRDELERYLMDTFGVTRKKARNLTRRLNPDVVKQKSSKPALNIPPPNRRIVRTLVPARKRPDVPAKAPITANMVAGSSRRPVARADDSDDVEVGETIADLFRASRQQPRRGRQERTNWQGAFGIEPYVLKRWTWDRVPTSPHYRDSSRPFVVTQAISLCVFPAHVRNELTSLLVRMNEIFERRYRPADFFSVPILARDYMSGDLLSDVRVYTTLTSREYENDLQPPDATDELVSDDEVFMPAFSSQVTWDRLRPFGWVGPFFLEPLLMPPHFRFTLEHAAIPVRSDRRRVDPELDLLNPLLRQGDFHA